MISRTPVAEFIPTCLVRRQTYDRTPVVSGVRAIPLSELVFTSTEADDTEVEASISLAEKLPGEDPIWDVAHSELIRSSLSYFFAEVISGPEEAPYHGHSLTGEHHEEWDDIIQSHDRALIEAARDHGKSHFFSKAYPLWMAGWRKPGSLGYIFSSTQDTAQALLELVKQELLENPKLAHLIPITRDRSWSKKEITLRNGSIIRARGMGVKVRGGHPRWIVVDDCLTDNDIYSETIRRRNIDYFLSAISNMIVPGGQIVVVGTPMNYGDLYGHLRGTGRYFCKKYPAIDKNGKILFPERYDRKRLKEKEEEMGPTRFAREFLCQPLSDESSMFPSKLFEGAAMVPYSLGLPGSYWRERGCAIYTGIDFAMSTSSSADWTVIFTVAVDEHRNRWVIDIRRGHGWGFQRQLDEIKEVYAIYKFDVAHAEANQFQRIFTDEIVRETDIPIRKFFTTGVQPRQPWRKGMGSLTMGKHSLDRGVPSLRMSMENGKWRWPRGDHQSIETTDIAIGELGAMSFQGGRVVSVGQHDDCVMAMWMCDTAVRAGGFRFCFGETDPVDVKDLDPAKDFSPPPVTAKTEDIAMPSPVPYAQTVTDSQPEEGSPTAMDIMMGNPWG